MRFAHKEKRLELPLRLVTTSIAILIFAFLVLFFSDTGQQAQSHKQNHRRFEKFAVPDAVTRDIRDASKVLVRVPARSPADLEVASRSGRLVENYGPFAVIARDKDRRPVHPNEQVLSSSVHLPFGKFDPLIELRPETVYAGGGTPENGYYILQFGGVVTDEWLDSLRDLGIEVLQYVPNQAFFVYGDGESIARAAEHSRVRWIGRFLPADKLPQVLLRQLSAAKNRSEPGNGTSALKETPAGRAIFDISIFSRADVHATAAEITGQYDGTKPRMIRLSNNFFNIIRVELPIDRVAEVAEIPDVIRIDSYGKPEIEDERAAQIVAGNYASTTAINPPGYNPLTQFGVDGTNVTVSVVDDGVSIPGNGGFYITSANAVDGPLRGATAGATTGHGHLNASIIAGNTPFGMLDPSNYNYSLGVAPKANILNIPLLVTGYAGDEADTLDDTVSTAGVNGVRGFISNNSWGNGLNGSAYDSYAAAFDGFVRDASSAITIDPLLIIFSAGNNGSGASTLTRPKAAKNLIAVGNSENIRTELGATGADNIDDLNGSSSRGPTFDGRIKPDVIAPGSYITGGRAGDCSLVSCFDANHVYSSGTSHAAPQVAGAAALFTQFWKDQAAGQNPSPALVKAAIINTGEEMNGSGTNTATLPNANEGWGRVNLKKMFNPAVTVKYINESVAFSDPGGTYLASGLVGNSSEPVRVTLVWTDPPAVTDPALVNNLDLTVTIGANTYKGNVFSSGSSVTGGSADTKDNVENVWLPAGIPAGTPFSITVTAMTLNGDGILGNADATDQNFALVAYNYGLIPTAAPADIAGRITDDLGTGIGRTSISLIGPDGLISRISITNAFGYYRFADVPTGHGYVVTPTHKRFVFKPASVFYSHIDEIADLDFVGIVR